MRSTLFLLALCLSVITGSAQSEGDSSYVFSGTLISEDDGVPIVNARISVATPDSTYTTVSDPLGEFYLSLPEKPLTFSVASFQANAEGLVPNDKGVYPIKRQTFTISGANVYASYGKTKWAESTSSISVLSTNHLNATDNSSLQDALNTVAGVKMESRGFGGSRRINIRGSFIRSPFAVRNIKIYLDGMPITSPDGQAALELIDDYDLGSIQIIKGPNGNSFGAGNGGVMQAFSKQPILGTTIESKFSIGSLGFYKSASSASFRNDKISVRVSYLNQHTDGFRRQEYNNREQLSFRLGFNATPRLQYSLWATDYRGEWALPGGVSISQIMLDPRAASEYAIENNTRVERNRQRIGISQKFTSRRIKNETSLYVNTTTKLNPYGTSAFFNGYKDETAQGVGGRNVFSYTKNLNSGWNIALQQVLEFTFEDNQLDEFDMLDAQAGLLRYANETTSSELVANVGVIAKRGNKFRLSRLVLEGGIGYSVKNINSTNVLGEAIGEGTSTVDRNFNSFLPYLGATYLLTRELSVFGAASIGYSPPSVFELLEPQNGVLSTELEAETAQNLEVGIRYHSKAIANLNAELNVYQMSIDNAIFQYEDSTDAVFFGNRQALDYQGIEGAVSKLFTFENDRFIKRIDIRLSGTLQNYRLKNAEFVDQENNYVAGVPLASASSQLMVVFPFGFEVTGTHNWYDRTPLDDGNAVFAAAYNLVNVKASWNLSSFKQTNWILEAFGGIQNVTNTQYTSFFNLNAFGGRYFNPMANESTYYGGIRVGKRF